MVVGADHVIGMDGDAIEPTGAKLLLQILGKRGHLAAALHGFWFVRGALSEGRAWVGQLIARAESRPAHALANRPLVAAIISLASRLAFMQGDLIEAERLANRSAVLADAAALVIAGGHVGVLAEVLHLFNIAAALRSAPVIAWSAGAMALADRIVLFHDRAPQGPGHPEVYGSGLSLLRDVVLLPHARARLLLDDTPRMAVFARRFSPARCVLLETGTRIEVPDGGWPPGTRVLGEDGHVTTRQAA